MTTPAPHPEVQESLSALTLKEEQEEENPWVASSSDHPSVVEPIEPLKVSNDPPPVEQPAFTPAATPPTVDENVLNEFDPLADSDELNARQAWAASEGHPPKPSKTPSPPFTPTKASEKPLPDSPSKTAPAPSSIPAVPSSTSTFGATFSNLARSFSRPRSSGSDAGVGAKAAPIPPPKNGDDSAILRPATPTAPLPSSASRSDSRAKPNDGQFDFQRFLDQLKTRSAEPVAQYFRSFLNHFSKRTFTVPDQVKLVQQFLTFIEPKMRECSVWKKESDEEFENSMEAMEKLVMNRIFDYTFTPQIAALGRQITTDDLERDHVLSQRIRLFGWVTETHLDIPQGENNEGFLNFAQQELLKINHYKAPRDKMICILNCCKVIFGLIRQLHKDEGADAFIPVLILVVLKANPEHLISNMEYIQRFRNPSKLQSEAGYYLSSIVGAVSFIETMDHTSLSSITQEEFERNVEEAIQELPPSPVVTPATPSQADLLPEPPKTPSAAPAPGEESASALQLPTPASVAEDTRKFLLRTGNLAQQTISKPLNAIGKILSEALDGMDDDRKRPDLYQWNHPDQIGQYAQRPQTPQGGGGPPVPIQMPYKARIRPGSTTPSPIHTPDNGAGPPPLPPRGGYANSPYAGAAAGLNPERYAPQTPSPRVAARNLEAEIGAIEDAHRQAARETVVQIFPGVDGEVIDMVLEANGGDLGRTIDALLEMSVTG